MAQPLLQLLKVRPGFQDVEIDVLCSPTIAAVWRAVPEVAEVIETTFRSGSLEWGSRRALAARLRTLGYAEAYILPNSLKSSLIPWLARIPRRIGYKGEMRYGLLNVVHHDAGTVPRPMVAFYAALANAPCRSVSGRSNLPRPMIAVNDARRREVLHHFDIDSESSVVAFAPGAEFGSAKRWPAGHFAELARRLLQQQPNLNIVLLGSPKDRPVCGEIVTAIAQAAGASTETTATITINASNIRNLAGTTSLDQAIALIAAASAIVSNDSGLLHVASALNRPVLALYGPTDPAHAPPFSEKSQSIHLQLPCMPCRQRECPLGHHDCMRKLDVGRVLAPLQAMIKSK